MTSGEPPSSPSAAKLGGFALIGVGALAAALGVATMTTGGSEDVAVPPAGEQTSSPLPPLPPQPPPETQQPSAPPPQAGQPTGQAPNPPAPPADQPRPQAPPEQAVPRIVVRVYNNSTIKGLAHRAADEFRSAGYEVPEVGNYARGMIPTTTVYYRPGTQEEMQAREVASAFQARVEPRFPGLEQASPGVVAIITNDYKGIPKGKGGE